MLNFPPNARFRARPVTLQMHLRPSSVEAVMKPRPHGKLIAQGFNRFMVWPHVFRVVEAHLYDGDVEEAHAALKKATEACAAQCNWDASKQDVGLRAGFSSVLVSYLVEELYADGGKREHFAAIDRAMRKLPEAELKRFLDESWPDDDTFNRRLSALLITEKFPSDDEYRLETARFIIEANVGPSVVTWDWIEAYINKR